MSVNSLAFGNAYPYQVPFQYGPYAASRIANKIESETGNDNEETLAGALAGGGLFMGAAQLGPKAIHPVNSFNAMRKADQTFNTLMQNEAFKNLSNADKMKAYSNMFDAERLGKKITTVKEGVRSQAESKKIYDSLQRAYNNYQQALKSGNKVNIAKYASEMETIIANGKKQNIFKRAFSKVISLGKETTKKAYTAAEVGTKATEAGKAAATAAKAEAAAVKDVSLLAKGKDILKSGGGKGMAGISGVLELFTEVIPAFSKGTDKGVKQIGKSAVMVAGDTAGWCVGYAAGAAVGAKVGLAVGTAICPGIGTAIGAVIGLAGGLLGSWLGRKTAKAVVGKSENEIAEEQEAKQAQMQQAQAQQVNPQIADEAAAILANRQAFGAQQAQTPQNNPFASYNKNYASNPYASGVNPYSMQNLSEVNKLFSNNYDSLSAYAC